MSDRKELLNQLKAIRLELFRNAASLDRTIAVVERELDDKSNDDEMKRMYIRAEQNYRYDRVVTSDWHKLFELEDVIWQQLVKS